MLFIFFIFLIFPIISHGLTNECVPKEGSEFIGDECYNYLNSIKSWLTNYKKLLEKDSSYWCHYKIKSTIDNEFPPFINFVGETVKNVGNNYLQKIDQTIGMLQNVRKKFIQSYNLDNNESVSTPVIIKRESVDSNVKSSSLYKMIPLMYRNNVTNGEQIVKYLETFTNVEEKILGYRILLDEMMSNEDLYSTLTMTIAYKVLNNFKKSYNSNQHFVHIQTNLPDSVKLFPWNKEVLIFNTKFQQILLSQKIYNFGRRWTILFDINQCRGSDCFWLITPESNGNFFHIKNSLYDEYLFASSYDFIEKNQTRRVFTWNNKQTLKQGRWLFEPVINSNNFKIKNLHWNEYLVINEEGKNKNVVTWIPGGCESDKCYWSITKD